ncbi:BON domain-containing protein [Thermomonospora echinospora]|uniref:BON domain-containing protein n=1 Tax=Thermomonospora echinospora TaxID=1992 RepID=A0A1H6EBH7_9ACTN|nr:CBS domain-containing protein [Thermomonospora echinospora]SEG94611.1 BON domain-containing protein [Thermomonospora echinospora]
MRRCRVKDVMTHDVVAIGAVTPYSEVLKAMAAHGVGALPVIDERLRVIGIITESDLLFEEHPAPVSPDEPWRRHEHAKAEATTAMGLMTSPVIAVTEEAPAARAARVLSEYGINQVPVTEPDGTLVGIVARSDLLRVFLRPDQEIHDEVTREALAHVLRQDSDEVTVTVCDGVVGLHGRVRAAGLVPVAVRLALSVEGVVDVVAELDYEPDDTASPPPG